MQPQNFSAVMTLTPAYWKILRDHTAQPLVGAKSRASAESLRFDWMFSHTASFFHFAQKWWEDACGGGGGRPGRRMQIMATRLSRGCHFLIPCLCSQREWSCNIKLFSFTSQLWFTGAGRDTASLSSTEVRHLAAESLPRGFFPPLIGRAGAHCWSSWKEIISITKSCIIVLELCGLSLQIPWHIPLRVA